MQRKHDTIKINLPGGVFASGELLQIVVAAEESRATAIRFGSRQQLYIEVPVKYTNQLIIELGKSRFVYEVNEDNYPNVLSSYVTENVFHHGAWMSEDGYKDTLDCFDFRPTLKINVVDSGQSFTPFFTGNLNFISSDIGNYWFLFIRFPKTNILYRWPVLVYSLDLARLSKLIQDTNYIRGNEFNDQRLIDGNELYREVNSKEHFFSQRITDELQLPEFRLPYYEGFNVYGNKTWLGIYRRNETFPISFLKDLCLLCIQTKIGQLHITPWKSLIIKGIESQHKKLWDYVLGAHRINVRHASNELNWQVEDLCEDGLILKRFIVSQFDRDDLRTFGLCFAIKTRPKSGLFGSVVIRRTQGKSTTRRMDRFDILYTKDFNPNSKDLILFRSEVTKENLPVYLNSLCKYYNELQNGSDFLLHQVYQEQASVDPSTEIISKKIHQCPDCLTVYDDEFGDPINGIDAGTLFGDLPENYVCPTCGESKNKFVEIAKSSIAAPL